MSFDNRYPNRKDWRKPFRKAKAFDRSCRCHGGCAYCRNNRLHQTKKEERRAQDSMRDFETG